jgi:hypothetical protein
VTSHREIWKLPSGRTTGAVLIGGHLYLLSTRREQRKLPSSYTADVFFSFSLWVFAKESAESTEVAVVEQENGLHLAFGPEVDTIGKFAPYLPRHVVNESKTGIANIELT